MVINCGDGLILSFWRPYKNVSIGDMFRCGLLHILLIVYLFIGVAIVSDK